VDIHRPEDVKRYLSKWLLDFAIGIYVYTYPFNGDIIDVTINRPSGFIVSEIINRYNLIEIYNELKNVKNSNIEDKCYENATYIVKKIGLDSIELCNTIKKTLNCVSCIALGLKDSNAIAYQLISLKKCRKIERYIQIKEKRKNIDAYLWLCGEIAIIDTKNSFIIEIKPVSQDSIEVINKRISMLRNYKYIILNFFGYQRFGSRRPVTHILGKKLVHRDWGGFIETICGYPFPTESRDSIASRLQWYESRDMLYPYNSIEKSICFKTIDSPLKIIKTIPKNTLQLYVNAYQSYLFNVVLSKTWLDIIERYDLVKALDIIRKDMPFLPILGASTQYPTKISRDILNDVLYTEDVKLEDFYIKELGLFINGDYRKSYMTIEDFQYSLSDNSIKLKFTLESGCYATIALREILYTDPLLYT